MSQNNHATKLSPEWRKDNTLTAPEDRNMNNPTTVDAKASQLTPEQVDMAMEKLNNTSYVERFPEVERRLADSPLEMQRICLFSFVPAKGATPNEKGVYGFAKVRGSFPTGEEANERALQLVKTDSYHQIYHAYVGRPFPITDSSEYSKEVSTVDLKNEMTMAVSEDVKKKREKEQREIEEIKQREEELLNDARKEKEDTDDHYTSLRVKKAQLVWTFSETEKKMRQMATLVARARKEIETLDTENPSLKNVYLEKYMEARKRAGLPTDNSAMEGTFMKYLVEELRLPALEDEYTRLFGENLENP